MPKQGEKMGKVIKYKESPFRKDLVIPVGTKLVKLMEGKETQLSLVSMDTGEEQSLFSFARRKVDKEEFVKYYTNTIAVQHDLGLAGRKVLDVVQYVVQKTAIDRDYIHLGVQELSTWNEREDIKKPISDSAWYRGIKNLIESGILARYENGQLGYYWVNPSIMFTGKRQIIMDLIELDESFIEGELNDDPMLTADKQKELGFEEEGKEL